MNSSSIEETYVDSIVLTESAIIDAWNESKRKLRSNIIKYEKTTHFNLSSRYDWKIEEEIIEMIGITTENGYELIGCGAGRAVYSTPFGTVLKVALDSSGISQNIEEFTNKIQKNSLGCFPLLIWKSTKGLVIETEMVSPYAEDDENSFLYDFKRLNGIDFSKYSYSIKCLMDGDDNSEENVDDIGTNPIFIIEKIRNPSNESQRMLKILTDYLLKRNDFSLSIEILRFDNWGKIIRNGSEVLIPIDVGGSERIMRKYYHFH